MRVRQILVPAQQEGDLVDDPEHVSAPSCRVEAQPPSQTVASFVSSTSGPGRTPKTTVTAAHTATTKPAEREMAGRRSSAGAVRYIRTTSRRYRKAATTAPSIAMAASQYERASTEAPITSSLAQNPVVNGTPACASSSTVNAAARVGERLARPS